jgi:hypothetical protein
MHTHDAPTRIFASLLIKGEEQHPLFYIARNLKNSKTIVNTPFLSERALQTHIPKLP